MKYFLFAVLCLSAIGCSQGGGSSGVAAATLEGVDFSGTYVIFNVQCWNSGLTAQTNAASFTGAYADTVTISGNSFSERNTSGGCTVEAAGRIVLDSNNRMAMSGVSVTSATGGSCTITESLTGGAISPNPRSTTYTTGQTFGAISNAVYVWNSTNRLFGILTTHTDGAGGYCFQTYQRQ